MLEAYLIIAAVICVGMVTYYTIVGGVQTIHDGGLLFITALALGVFWLPALALGAVYFASGAAIYGACKLIHRI